MPGTGNGLPGVELSADAIFSERSRDKEFQEGLLESERKYYEERIANLHDRNKILLDSKLALEAKIRDLEQIILLQQAVVMQAPSMTEYQKILVNGNLNTVLVQVQSILVNP